MVVLPYDVPSLSREGSRCHCLWTDCRAIWTQEVRLGLGLFIIHVSQPYIQSWEKYGFLL